MDVHQQRRREAGTGRKAEPAVDLAVGRAEPPAFDRGEVKLVEHLPVDARQPALLAAQRVADEHVGRLRGGGGGEGDPAGGKRRAGHLPFADHHRLDRAIRHRDADDVAAALVRGDVAERRTIGGPARRRCGGGGREQDGAAVVLACQVALRRSAVGGD